MNQCILYSTYIFVAPLKKLTKKKNKRMIVLIETNDIDFFIVFDRIRENLLKLIPYVFRK